MGETAEGKEAGDGGKQADVIDYEKMARDEGWRPKDELGDEFDAARYVGAEEFIKRKPLFDTIKQQSKKIKELTQTVDSVVQFSQKNAELAAKRAVAELTKQKKEAIQAGEVETVEALDKTIKEHEKVIEDAGKQKPNQVPAEILEWTEKNPWFDADPDMQDFAVAFTSSWAKRHPKESMEKALEETTKAVKKAYPDSQYFKTRRSDPPVVEGHKGDGADTGGDGGSKNKGYTVGRLTEEQRLTYNAYVKKNKIMTHDQYFQKLEEIGALEK